MSSRIAAEEMESLKLLLVESHAQHADAHGSDAATCKHPNCVELESAIAWLTQRLHHHSTSSCIDNQPRSIAGERSTQLNSHVD